MSEVYTTIPALTQPKVGKSMDHGSHKLVGGLMKMYEKKGKKKSGTHKMPNGKMMKNSEMKSGY